MYRFLRHSVHQQSCLCLAFLNSHVFEISLVSCLEMINDFRPDFTVVDHNSELAKEVREGERRVALYRRRLEKLQADYHNLIGITADLVDTLEATLQGKQVALAL